MGKNTQSKNKELPSDDLKLSLINYFFKGNFPLQSPSSLLPGAADPPTTVQEHTATAPFLQSRTGSRRESSHDQPMSWSGASSKFENGPCEARSGHKQELFKQREQKKIDIPATLKLELAIINQRRNAQGIRPPPIYRGENTDSPERHWNRQFFSVF